MRLVQRATTLIILSIAVAAQGAIPDAERQALISLYDATAGDSWTNKTGWKGAAGTECTWFGVTCDSAGATVSGINLGSNNLAGTFPALPLTNLANLDLEKNHLSGPLPDFPAGSNLSSLLLASNALVGEIPRSFLNLTKLRLLGLEFNGLRSSDPQVQALVNAIEPNVLNFQTVAPTGVVALPDNRSTITVSWTQLRFPTNTTHYDIYSGSTLLRSVPFASNVATFTGLDSSKSYDFRIQTVADPHANNTNRIASDFSATVQATPAPAPSTFDIGVPNLHSYWVDPVRGNDSNDGSSLRPFKTIDAAFDAARSNSVNGYEVVLRPGDYPQDNFLSLIIGSGSQEAPVILRADVPDTAVLHGLLTASGSHVYIVGLKIEAQSGGSAFIAANVDYLLLRDVHTVGQINVNISTHVYVEDALVEPPGGITLDAVQYGHVSGSRISAGGAGGCVTVLDGSAYLTVDSNNIGPCGFGGGVEIGLIGQLNRATSPWIHYDVYDVKVTNNVIHDPGPFGVLVAGAYNALFAQNTVITSSGVFVSASLASRTCEVAADCQTRHDAGGWGPTTAGASVFVPNRNVTIAGNIFYSPTASPQLAFVNALSPDSTGSPAATNIANPVRSDDNLQIRGNLVWAPQSQLMASGGGCDNSNPTCNAAQLATDNRINAFQPQFVDAAHGNYRPLANGNLFGLPAVTIAPFTWTDAPTQPPVPQGELVNTVARDADNIARTAYVPGAFTKSTPPMRHKAVKHGQ